MKTGIVFKTDGRKAVVMKADGSFISVRAQRGWEAGQVVCVPAAPQSRAAPFLAMAACLVLVVFGGFGWNALYTAPVALISLDVNPSIELGVNRFDRVVSATALNGEGAEILTEANIRNAGYRQALAAILNAEGADGYLTADANVVLTVFSADPAVQASLLEELQNVVSSETPLSLHTEYHAVDESTVNGAHVHGVTAGKYLYLQELQALAPETDLSAFTHHSIDQIKGEIAACRRHDEAEEGGHHGGTHCE